MAQEVSRIKIIREFETEVHVFPSVCRFITIVGAMLDINIVGGDEHAETYTCQVGPVLKEHEFMGASCLPSIALLEPTTAEGAQCVIESWNAIWIDDPGHVELRVQVSAAGGPAKIQILFSVTILAER